MKAWCFALHKHFSSTLPKFLFCPDDYLRISLQVHLKLHSNKHCGKFVCLYCGLSAWETLLACVKATKWDSSPQFVPSLWIPVLRGCPSKCKKYWLGYRPCARLERFITNCSCCSQIFLVPTRSTPSTCLKHEDTLLGEACEEVQAREPLCRISSENKHWTNQDSITNGG